MKSVLITGATGLVGYSIYQYLARHTNWSVITTSRTGNDFINYTANLADHSDVISLSHRIKPDIIIHTAAMSKTDICEQNKKGCYDANVTSTNNIATCFPDSTLLFFSTYAVYNTKEGSCSETNETRPTNYYIETKLEAEAIIRQLKNSIIFRPSVMFGYMPFERETKNYFMQLLENIQKNITTYSPKDQYFNPIFITIVCEIIKLAIEQGISGVYNLGCNENVSKYDFNTLILKEFNFSKDAVIGVTGDSLDVKRPGNGTISSDAIQKSLSYKIVPLSSMIEMLHTSVLSCSKPDIME